MKIRYDEYLTEYEKRLIKSLIDKNRMEQDEIIGESEKIYKKRGGTNA